MRLTVVGSSASYAGPGQACSGYLVTSGRTRILMDCGNGSLANLAKVIDPGELDAIFITHRHPDHFLDMFAMQALLRYAPSGPAAPVALYSPDGLLDAMACVLDGRGHDDMLAAFVATPFVTGVAVNVGDLAVTPVLVDHVDDTYALRVQNADGLLCYTSDSRFGQAALEAAAGADVLLAEATLPQEYAGRAPHMTAAEAGTLGREVGAHRLVLTHLWPTNDRDRTLADARDTFSGEVVLATEMLEVAIP
jgi:ribonuclease BN (tRNA processing enzyme)